MSIEAPKPLDDPRLQGLFSDAISGALAFGAQNTNPPPAGHWLERFWQMGRAERALSEAAASLPQKARPDFIAGYDAGLIDGRACAARDAAPPAAELVSATAKPLVWERDNPRQWSDKHCGFYITLDDPEDADHDCPYFAAWGEGDEGRFATLAEAQAWCQRKIDGWIALVATAAPAVPQTEPVKGHRYEAGDWSMRNWEAMRDDGNAAPQTEKDATRYRWIRDTEDWTGLMECAPGEATDAFIDAAMATEQPK
jgi:hypothetical protein